jgi:hypothetical protein
MSRGRSSPLTAAVTPRSRSRPRPGPSTSAFLVLVGHPSVPGDRLSIVTGAVTTRRTFHCSDGPGACLGYGAGDNTRQLRYRAGSRDLTLTSGNAQEQQRSWGHAVYGMQGVRGSSPLSSTRDQIQWTNNRGPVTPLGGSPQAPACPGCGAGGSLWLCIVMRSSPLSIRCPSQQGQIDFTRRSPIGSPSPRVRICQADS